ncbi:carbon-nitrogen hydrolase family protein [Thermodesulfovibrio aggregans]|uniref:Carbon-nitrogen hydrolase family protein n=1 Tax=Thermodesulfovibrio aggregans TaxID=86166 RepID=A0A0U9HN26_9BACT|nr:carbon-nitrogen family hydrolase [Thermodesulfovibrio aggregans]GAQ94276.1 carbon-nitrogen hydrolase family protein [Thermodesulfovibrio aggregans]
MKLALIQMNILWQKREENLKRADFFIKTAADEGCDVVVFPEMFDTGFFPPLSTIDEGLVTDFFLSNAAKKYRINIIAGFAVKKENKARNIARVYNRSGSIIAEYTKINLFSFMNEDRFFIAGTEPVIFEIDALPASVFICYDLRFPEVFRKIAKDVVLIFVIANWPSSRIEHWKTLLQARAIENQCFMIGVNRTGKDSDGVNFSGSSCIYDPWGKPVLIGDEEEFLLADIDLSQVERIRNEFPFMKDMK